MTALGGSKAGCSEKQRTKLYCDCWKSSWALVHAGRWILRKPDQTKRVTFYFIKKRGIHFLHLLICHLGVFWGKLAFLAEVMLCCTFCSCRLTENIFLWKLIHWKSCRRTSVISYSHCQMTCRTSCSKLAQRDFCVCVCVDVCVRRKQVDVVWQKTVAYEVRDKDLNSTVTLQMDFSTGMVHCNILTVFLT